MPIDTTKTFEVENGLGIVGAGALYSGPGAPSFTAVDGSVYLQIDAGTNPSLWQRRNSVWVKATPFARTVDFTAQSTTSASYVAIHSFIFRGTTVAGTPISAKACVRFDNVSGVGAVRLVNAANGLVICEATGLSGQSAAAKNLGALSNLPAAEAIIEIQHRLTSGLVTGSIFTSGIVMEF